MKKLKIVFLFLTLISLSTKSYSQILEETGNIFDRIASNISSMPSDSGNQYQEPNLSQLNTWKSIIDNLIDNSYSKASDSANTISYQLISFTDTFESTDNQYYILENIDTNYWGTYVFNPEYCRSLIIQAPHSKNDANTGHQGIYIFRETKAMFYQVNGTHRCNSASFSSCSGTTSTCSSTSTSEAYRISDLAHTTQSLFQKTTEVLFHSFDDTYFIQLHGFSKLSTDPFLILSNGTQETPTLDYMSSFKNFLYEEDTVLSFKIAHIDTNWTRLRGFWNTQSRYVNESTDACNDNASITEGRFFHVEQERIRLRNDITGWTKVSNALKNTFECVQDTSLIEDTTVIEEPNTLNNLISQNKISIYPNPTKQFITLETNTIELDLKIYNLLGEEISDQISINKNTTKLDLTLLPQGIYILQLNDQVYKIIKN